MTEIGRHPCLVLHAAVLDWKPEFQGSFELPSGWHALQSGQQTGLDGVC